MSEIPPLILDLALILVVAGIVTLVFKRLKQPLVLGYIVAGFLVSPHMPYTMSVVDHSSIHTWAEIGVIFLLFSLGLDFSFKKILKMGASPIIATCTIIFSMMMLGIIVGKAFGWGKMDCIFLGGMLAMSSTTISVLILEDILAIVMMVMLAAIASGTGADGGQMLQSIVKIGFFLVLWFVVGIFAIPWFLRSVRKLVNNEVLLVVSLGLCCAMAVLSTQVGFSSAFGAFIMGSILAETIEAEKIIRLVEPVKNLFGAIFFVSVGMLVDPNILVEYALPIIAIVLTILLGQSIFGTIGFMLSGQTLKSAMRCGFSMAQIGEFSFIIASLGLSLGVISKFLYPVNRISVNQSTTATDQNLWKRLLIQMLRNTIIYSILSAAITAIMLTFFVPFMDKLLGNQLHFWTDIICGLLTILLISPFLRAIVMKKNHSEEFKALWTDNRLNRLPLIFTILVRLLIALSFIFYICNRLTQFSNALIICIGIALLVLMILSRSLKQRSIRLERMFIQNLRSRDIEAQVLGKKKPLYEGHLLDRDVHIAEIDVPDDSTWVGKTLGELQVGRRFGVHVSSILRGRRRINIPGGDTVLFPNDRIQVIGSDDQLANFNTIINKELHQDDPDIEKREMKLRQIIVNSNSPFIGKTLQESGIRDIYNCMVVGLEEGEENLTAMSPARRFEKGDIIWIVGEEDDLKRISG